MHPTNNKHCFSPNTWAPSPFEPQKGIDYSNRLFPINSINQHPTQKALKLPVCLSFQNRSIEPSRASKRFVYSTINGFLSKIVTLCWTMLLVGRWSLVSILFRKYSTPKIKSDCYFLPAFSFFFQIKVRIHTISNFNILIFYDDFCKHRILNYSTNCKFCTVDYS